MIGAFQALSNRNYRLWATGASISNLGTWMQRTAQDWLVLVVLTNHSGLAVGITTGLQFAPLLIFSAHAGVLADRLPKRAVLLVTQSTMGMTSLAIGVVVELGAAQLWEVYCAALLLGIASAIDNPTRQAFVSEVVPRDQVISAVSLNSASMNAARLVGPGLAGLMISAWGTGPGFLLNAVSFVATVIALLRMRVSELQPARQVARAPGQVREGLRYVRSRPDLVAVLFLVATVSGLGLNFQLTNALMAVEAFHRGPREYGLLGTMLGVGCLSAALLAARRVRPRLRLLMASTSLFGVLVSVSALSPSYLLFALLLVAVGMCSITVLNSCNTLVQLSTPPQYRGRVLALYVSCWQGSTPIGAPLIGWVGGQFGARWAVLVGGLAAVLASAIVFAVMSRRPELEDGFEHALDLAAAEAEREDLAAVAPQGKALRTSSEPEPSV